MKWGEQSSKGAAATTDGQFAIQILKDAPIILLLLDLDGRIQYVNTFFERLTGYRSDEVQGRLWFDTFLPERDREATRVLFGRCVAGQHVSAHINPILTRAGDERQIAWTDEFLRDGEGRTTGILAVGQDVSERVRQELRHRSLIAAIHDGVVVQSANGEVVDCNAAAERMLGLSIEEMTGRTAMDPRWRCVHEDGTPFLGADQPGAITLRTGTAITDVVMGIHHPDGRLVWLLINAVPIFGRDDDAILGTVVSFTDITERKRSDAALREKEILLARAQETAHLGTFQFDPVTQSVQGSDELFRIFGVSREEFAFSHFSDAVHPDQRAFVVDTIRDALENRRSYDITHDLLLRDGTLKHVRAIGEPILGATGTLLLVGTVQDITERVQGEQIRDIERARLREAQRIAKMGSWELDLVTNALAWTDEIYDIFEIDPTQFSASYEAFLALIHPEDRAAVDAAYQASVTSRSPYDIVHRLLMPDGRLKWVREIGQTFYESSGRALRSTGTVQDITERRNAADAVRRSDELLRTIIKGAPVVIFALDRQGLFRFSDGRALEKMGLRPGQVVGASAHDLYGSIPGFAATFQRALAGEQAMLSSNLGSLAFEAAYGPSYDDHGEIDGVIGVGFDVTERLAAESSLREREARLAAVFEHTSDAMSLIVVGSDGSLRLSAMNRAAVARLKRATDTAASELIGLTIEQIAVDIYHRPPDAVARTLDAYRRAIHERTPVSFEDATEVRDGILLTEVTAIPIIESSGSCRQVIWSARDVTAARLADSQLRASLREKETLLKEIHHRVKNNLQVITGLLHFQTKKLSSPEDKVALAELRQRINTMTLLHERLYRSPDMANVQFGEYARAVVEELVHSISRRRGVSIDVEATGDLRLPTELAMPCGMIVTELVTNVLKYAFPDEREGTATVTLRAVNNRVLIDVDDDGVGFPDDFDPTNGASFGWELLQTLVRQINGTVTAATDRGAHVRVSFPAPPPLQGAPR